jgi:predicted protein tyrosine phosphatase
MMESNQFTKNIGNGHSMSEENQDWETESRIGNCSNKHQGKYKKVLAVCSAGLLRSPTIAWVLSQKPYEYNCRASGTESDYALIKLDDVLLEWADEVVCADSLHYITVKDRLKELGIEKPILNMELPDVYQYRHPKLVKLIEKKYNAFLSSKLPVNDAF